MKVVNLYRLNNPTGRIKATFNLDFGILIVRECKLIEGSDGRLWAAMPSRSYMENGKKIFAGIVAIKNDRVMDVITNAAREVYEVGAMEGSDKSIAVAAHG
jgi:DNA-binding cell septation regulator SpoVG